MWWSKITNFFAFPLSFKVVSFHDLGKVSIICNQYIFWVSVRWNSIFISSQGFIFLLSLNNWSIKFKFLSEKRKIYRLTVNLKIWVKPNELRQDHRWKSWFCSIVNYPFYENILIKRWRFLKNVIAYINIIMKWRFLKNVIAYINIIMKWRFLKNVIAYINIIMKLKILPKSLHINSGIIFQLWKPFSNNLFTQEHSFYLPFLSHCEEYYV